MASIADRLKEARDTLRGQLRAGDIRSDIGLAFTAWSETAHQRLISAATDDDPACVAVYCTEAKVAALMAVDAATNPRQVNHAEQLVNLAEQVKSLAQGMAIPAKPHTHSID
jgi:hypothetical protein